MKLISDIRMGVSIGILKDISISELNKLICNIQTNCIISAAGNLTDVERDTERAELIRQALNRQISSDIIRRPPRRKDGYEYGI